MREACEFAPTAAAFRLKAEATWVRQPSFCVVLEGRCRLAVDGHPPLTLEAGTHGGPPDVRLPGGYFVFDSPDAALLLSLLPALVHVRGAERLSMVVRLVGEESSERPVWSRPVRTRLVEVLLIEALRSSSGEDAPPGLGPTTFKVIRRHGARREEAVLDVGDAGE